MDRGDLIPFNTIIVTVVHRAKDELLWWWYPNIVAAFELIHTETKCVLIYNINNILFNVILFYSLIGLTSCYQMFNSEEIQLHVVVVCLSNFCHSRD